MKIENDTTIDASADAVWEVVAHRFDRIGEWATAIPASRSATPTPSAGSAADAPVRGRVCETSFRMFPAVEEWIIERDERRRRLAYEPSGGMPSFVTEARNRWTVTPIDERHARVGFEATVVTRGLLGRALGLVMRLQMRRAGTALLADLAHYVEQGEPSPRKRRQLGRGASEVGAC